MVRPVGGDFVLSGRSPLKKIASADGDVHSPHHGIAPLSVVKSGSHSQVPVSVLRRRSPNLQQLSSTEPQHSLDLCIAHAPAARLSRPVVLCRYPDGPLGNGAGFRPGGR